MKYQKAGRPRYCRYSPYIESMKWKMKKKKFQIRLSEMLSKLKLSAIAWFSAINLI